MSIIIVNSQKDLDAIPLDTEDIIKIEFGTFLTPAIVVNCYKHRVIAYGNSTVKACENSSVKAYENSTVKAYGNSTVKACENSSVKAYENSTVKAYGNSTVKAYGNVQVVDFCEGAIIKIFENARTVSMPRNINEFMNFYRIKHDETTAIFYKAVHKKNSSILYADGKKVASFSEYVSDYDEDFKYKIGKKNKI